ncbi:unnamed protein product [Musa hybrid cultivar]
MYDSGEIFSTWIGEDCCRWRGVACDNTTSHVIKLDLHYPYSYTDDWDDEVNICYLLNEMGASKVNPALRDLKHLKYLDLSMNNFFGSHIPHMIASLVHLEYLNLSNAMFGGLIPPQLGNLSKLHFLDLGGCGHIDRRADDLDWLSRIPSLKHVDMSSVNLSKATNWLHQVNSIPSLEVLQLRWASLPYIPSPPPPFNLTSIVKLDLSGYSNLNTTILRWLSHASSFAYLDLSSSSGIDIESIQVTLGALSNLKELYLQYNGIKGNFFGMIMNVSRSLKYLDLSGNSLSGDIGQISRSLSPFGMLMNVSSRLKHLDLSGNSLSGDIGQILRSLGSLEYLALDENNLDGDILEMVKNAPSSLQYLSLKFSHITGEIPQKIKNLTNLEYLDLSYTNITEGMGASKVNPALHDLKYLKHLDLSMNNCFGANVPLMIASFMHLEYLNLSNAMFDGLIPPQLGNLSNLHYLDIKGCRLSDLRADDLDWLSRISSLIYVDMSFVNLSKATNWLHQVNSIRSLKVLHLKWANLPFVLSPSFPFNLTSIVKLDISGYLNLNTTILRWLSHASSLVYLDLASCKGVDTESLQITLGALSNLKEFNLQYNGIKGEILGIVMNVSKSLKHLDLSGNSLSGDITQILWNLGPVEYLALDGNELDGDISEMVKNFTSSLRYLSLRSNHIAGEIPQIIDNLTNLEYLDLSYNGITGGILMTFGNIINLESLRLSGNKISGQIPESIGNLQNMLSLDLSKNFITGQMPETFDRLYNLEYLNVSYNNLSGIIPLSMGQLSALSELDLSSNSLKGNITEAHFSKLTDLTLLDISYNSLNVILPNDWLPPFNAYSIFMGSCHMETKFPAWIHTQTRLEQLSLSGVGLSGNLPTWFSDFSKGLSNLNLSSNNLNGPLPSAAANEVIDLSNNSFVGPIPLSFANTSNLAILSLSHNNINGSFPSFFCNFNYLQVLDLSNNNLSGEVPTCHKSFPTSLRSLHLNHNNLSGRFPSFLKHCEQLVTLVSVKIICMMKYQHGWEKTFYP